MTLLSPQVPVPQSQSPLQAPHPLLTPKALPLPPPEEPPPVVPEETLSLSLQPLPYQLQSPSKKLNIANKQIEKKANKTTTATTRKKTNAPSVKTQTPPSTQQTPP